MGNTPTELLAKVADNPMAGDKVVSPQSQSFAKTRTVRDRNFGGDVIYVNGRYEYRCTLNEWRDFCRRRGARVVQLAKAHVLKTECHTQFTSEKP